MKLKHLISALFHEYTTREAGPRVTEPCELMEDTEQVKQYSEGGELTGAMMPLYLLFLLQASRDVKPGTTVVDLGCGPGQFTLLLAACFPETRFIGVDASDTMLARAEKNRGEIAKIFGRELKNADFRKSYMQTLPFPDGSVDGVVSTLALHHLPDVATLTDVFKEARRILKANGTVYFADLLRPKSAHSIDQLVRLSYQGPDTAFLAEDYRHSLRAAFSVEELKAATTQSGLRLTLSRTATLNFLFTLRRGVGREIPQAAKDAIARLLREMPMSLRMDYRLVKLLLVERQELGG